MRIDRWPRDPIIRGVILRFCPTHLYNKKAALADGFLNEKVTRLLATTNQQRGSAEQAQSHRRGFGNNNIAANRDNRKAGETNQAGHVRVNRAGRHRDVEQSGFTDMNQCVSLRCSIRCGPSGSAIGRPSAHLNYSTRAIANPRDRDGISRDITSSRARSEIDRGTKSRQRTFSRSGCSTK